MKKYIKKLPKEIQDAIYLASDVALKDNMPIYLVGGFVRDLILGVKNLDLDIVVEGDGIKFAEDFANTLKIKLIRHRRFGTATVVLSHDLKIDIATSRKEIYPYPGSLPVVSSGSLRDDLARRDFTINAMAISITKDGFGKFIDFFKGADDLVNKKIRVLHRLSFIDDPTRILRAIRFEKRYNFRIESETLSYIREAIRLRMLDRVQPQRLNDELVLILKEEQPLKQIKRIQRLVGLDFIKPHLSLSKSNWILLRSIDRQIKWFKRVYPRRRRLDAWIIYFMGLIDSLNLNETEKFCSKFGFCKGDGKRIINCKKISRRLISQLRQRNLRPSRIFHLFEPLSYEVIIFIKSKYPSHNIQKHIEDFLEIYNGMRIQICGDDLQRLGVAPGPFYQKIFSRVLKAKFEGRVKTKEEELDLIRKFIENI